jgi:hypothetical protein
LRGLPSPSWYPTPTLPTTSMRTSARTSCTCGVSAQATTVLYFRSPRSSRPAFALSSVSIHNTCYTLFPLSIFSPFCWSCFSVFGFIVAMLGGRRRYYGKIVTIHIPRTLVNKGMKKDRCCYALARLARPPLGSLPINLRIYAAPFPTSMMEHRAISKTSSLSRTFPSPRRRGSSALRRS